MWNVNSFVLFRPRFRPRFRRVIQLEPATLKEVVLKVCNSYALLWHMYGVLRNGPPMRRTTIHLQVCSHLIVGGSVQSLTQHADKNIGKQHKLRSSQDLGLGLLNASQMPTEPLEFCMALEQRIDGMAEAQFNAESLHCRLYSAW